MWSSNKQNKHAYKNGAWILTREHKRVQSLAGFLSSVSFPLLYQFKLLPELFQDEEKVLSPTSAAPSGRVPLSRTAVKPAKARPGQASKEHKKTVGHQVSLQCGSVKSPLPPAGSEVSGGLVLGRSCGFETYAVDCDLHFGANIP